MMRENMPPKLLSKSEQNKCIVKAEYKIARKMTGYCSDFYKRYNDADTLNGAKKEREMKRLETEAKKVFAEKMMELKEKYAEKYSIKVEQINPKVDKILNKRINWQGTAFVFLTATLWFGPPIIFKSIDNITNALAKQVGCSKTMADIMYAIVVLAGMSFGLYNLLLRPYWDKLYNAAKGFKAATKLSKE